MQMQISNRKQKKQDSILTSVRNSKALSQQPLDFNNSIEKFFFKTSFANNLVGKVENINWEIKSEQEAKEVAQYLIDCRVAMSKLLMDGIKSIFKTKNIELFKAFYKELSENDVFAYEDKQPRLDDLIYAYSMRECEDLPTIEELRSCPMEIVKFIIPKPKNVNETFYIEWLNKICLKLQPSDIAIKILLLDQLNFYDSNLQSQNEAIKALKGELEEFNCNNNVEKVPLDLHINENMEARLIIIQKILKKLPEEYKEDQHKRLRMSIADYVMNAEKKNPNNVEKAVNYAVAVTLKDKHYGETFQSAINQAKKTFRVVCDYEKNKKSSDLLEKILCNSRLKRAIIQNIITNFRDGYQGSQLETLKFAAGYQDSDAILKVMQKVDYKTSQSINILMSDIMHELKSQYNLDPTILGAAGRSFHNVMSYPAWIFFYVWDCISYCLECAVSLYTKEKVEKADAVVEEFNSAFEDIDIVMSDQAAARNLEDISSQVSDEIYLPHVDELKNNLIQVLRDYKRNPQIEVAALKIKLIAPNNETLLKKELTQLGNCKSSKDLACGVYKLLQGSEMKKIGRWSEGVKNSRILAQFMGL